MHYAEIDRHRDNQRPSATHVDQMAARRATIMRELRRCLRAHSLEAETDSDSTCPIEATSDGCAGTRPLHDHQRVDSTAWWTKGEAALARRIRSEYRLRFETGRTSIFNLRAANGEA